MSESYSYTDGTNAVTVEFHESMDTELMDLEDPQYDPEEDHLG